MEVIFLPDAVDDLNYWIYTGNKPILKKITQLIEDIKLPSVNLQTKINQKSLWFVVRYDFG